jgi:hypothetical protein
MPRCLFTGFGILLRNHTAIPTNADRAEPKLRATVRARLTGGFHEQLETQRQD